MKEIKNCTIKWFRDSNQILVTNSQNKLILNLYNLPNLQDDIELATINIDLKDSKYERIEN